MQFSCEVAPSAFEYVPFSIPCIHVLFSFCLLLHPFIQACNLTFQFSLNCLHTFIALVLLALHSHDSFLQSMHILQA